MSIFRCTGTVTEVGAREGLIKAGPKAGEPYSIPYVVVSLNDFVQTTLNVPDHLAGKIAQGEMVDYIVDVSYSNGYMRAAIMNSWPREAAAPAARPASRPLASAASI